MMLLFFEVGHGFFYSSFFRKVMALWLACESALWYLR